MNRSRLAMPLLLLATLGVYAQTYSHDFVGFDDNQYIYRNPHVITGLTLANIKWAFTAFHSSNWHPLTWISHMVDVQLFGLQPPAPSAMKLHNVVLHIVNTWLVFCIIAAIGKRTTGAPAGRPLRGESGDDGHQWCAVFCAAVFALHPLHVESVAWVSERKDVLSTAFGFAALLVWIDHTRKPSRWRYAATLGLFAASLMSKPMFVTLPCVMLLIDWWFPRTGKLRWVVIEKLPMFALVAASCVVTYMAQHSGGAVASLEHIPLNVRLGNAVVSYIIYAWKTLVPTDLAALYPHPGARPWMAVAAASAALLAITATCIRLRRAMPHLLVGWLWYLGTLVPVIGVVQVGRQSMADRYMYVPMVGLLIMVEGVWTTITRTNGLYARKLTAVAATWLVMLTVVAAIQISYWRDTITLFSHAVVVAKRQWGATDDRVVMLLNYFGVSLARGGHIDTAIDQFEAAREINPNDVTAIGHLARAYLQVGQRDAAQHYARILLDRNAGLDAAHQVQGTLALDDGQIDVAIEHFRQSLLHEPKSPIVRFRLGVALHKAGQLDEAIEQLTFAASLNPWSIETWMLIGRIEMERGRRADAAVAFERVLRIHPGHPEAQELLTKARDGAAAP